jgi:hypothetical protein
MPKRKNADWYPLLRMRSAIGWTVNAEPKPNPAAVSPAASPRRSVNHLSELPTAVP